MFLHFESFAHAFVKQKTTPESIKKRVFYIESSDEINEKSLKNLFFIADFEEGFYYAKLLEVRTSRLCT